MRNFKRLCVVAIALMLVAGTAALASDEVTVGQFIQQLARAKNLNATDPATAATSLAAAGIRLPAGLNFSSRLTEGDIARIAQAAGLNVRSRTPDLVVDDEMMGNFFVAFGVELDDDGDDPITPACHPEFDPNCTNNSFKGKGHFAHGKGKGKGHRSPTEPE